MAVVKFYSAFKEIFKNDVMELNDVENLNDLLSKLAELNPKFQHYLGRDDFVVLVNGASIPRKEFNNVKLRKDDVIELFPPVSGG
ncbi:MAG: hypothetical protein B7O98_08240 [Zestosphaera tikiterensis]|uniref:Molybdopterin synthase sulfur carrier subunit n=1 Tax=Zestosphaera tikiterensis TaxID=1973259 RepID=A0A2R7Y2Y6_9CREN|nr:MAG: hypothetical protein B7O98_08240 [Zestosphaera tikiterensis]